MADVTIQILKNGPLLVRGPIELKDASGTVMPSAEPTVALCRCGRSSKKPFCDGTHKTVGFQG